MSKHSDWIVRIEHMIEAIEKIERFTMGMDTHDFEEDEKTFHAVERCFEVWGEASNAVPENIQDRYPEIEWRKTKAMRNVIAHQYFDVSEDKLWDTIKNDLPPLKEKLQGVLEGTR